jgi:hypothetical protein
MLNDFFTVFAMENSMSADEIFVYEKTAIVTDQQDQRPMVNW